jgi:DNA polymerase III alpha subunit (gram-positive type)
MTTTDRPFLIFDIEADALLDRITKIHCLSYSTPSGDFRGTLIERSDLEEFFQQDAVFVGHYIIGYDFRALTKIYNIAKPKHFIDTLGLCWALHPDRESYGLESYGETFGVPKPKIDDWENLKLLDYVHRCETDVEINRLLFNQLVQKLSEIYE